MRLHRRRPGTADGCMPEAPGSGRHPGCRMRASERRRGQRGRTHGGLAVARRDVGVRHVLSRRRLPAPEAGVPVPRPFLRDDVHQAVADAGERIRTARGRAQAPAPSPARGLWRHQARSEWHGRRHIPGVDGRPPRSCAPASAWTTTRQRSRPGRAGGSSSSVAKPVARGLDGRVHEIGFVAIRAVFALPRPAAALACAPRTSNDTASSTPPLASTSSST